MELGEPSRERLLGETFSWLIRLRKAAHRLRLEEQLAFLDIEHTGNAAQLRKQFTKALDPRTALERMLARADEQAAERGAAT